MNASFAQKGTRYTLLFEPRLPHSAEKVWPALTERQFLRQWFPCDIEGEWKEGAALRFIFQHGEDEGLEEAELQGEVLTINYPSHLEFRWGNHFYDCKLIAEGDDCQLIFSDSFEDPSEGARTAAGWEMCLENLVLILAGALPAKFAMEVWQGKFIHYRKKFEEAVGPQQGLPESYPDNDAQRDAAVDSDAKSQN